MSDVKPTETAPVVEPVVETKTAEETPAVAPVAEAEAAAPAAEVEAAAETTEAPAATEETKTEEEEKKPVDEGHLSHKPEGANFPKNLIHSKKFFWFGVEPVDVKAASSFKADKVTDVAHHVTAWAAETGKGLLFFGEKDKAAPQGVIQLAEASEPATDGANKFHFTSKGHKHSFKAATSAERDAWVAQLKAKIAEAKELASTVTESETYKKTLESLKPAKKEEKAVEPAAETTEATEAVAAAPVAEAATEAPKEEEAVVEEPKRRSASRKRASIFGSFLGKKEEKKAEAATEAEAPVAEASAATETPAVETVAEPAAVETPAVAAEAATEEKKEEAADVRPTAAKRSSLFGALSFGKKKVTSPEPTPTTEEAPATTEAVAENAPVIPAVETTEPLSAEVSSPATVPTTEITEAAPATNGETKKEVKSDKRKSSLPFVGAFLTTKEKATSDEEGDKPKSPSRFSKLRATIKGKKNEKVEKAEDKTEETPAAETSAIAEETPKPVEAEAAAPEEPTKAVAATPVVTAAA